MGSVGGLGPWVPWTPLVVLARWTDDRLTRITQGRWWAWWSAATAAALGMVVAAPPFGGFAQDSSPLWQYTLQNSGPQLFDPAVDLDGQTGNLTFRVVPRLIGALLHLDRWWQFQLVQLAFGFVLLWAAAHLFDEALRSRVLAAVATIATAATWAGATAWVETRGLFDAIALAFLALAMLARRPLLVAACALAASFTDERALVALPLVVAWHAFRPPPPEVGGDAPDLGWAGGRDDRSVRADLRRFVRPAPLVLVMVVVAHVALRTWLKHRYALSEGRNRYPEDPWTQLRNYPNGLWGALEGLWLVVVAGIATALHRRRWVLAACLVIAGLPSLLVGMSVVDVSRAIAYAWPLAPLAALGLGGTSVDGRRRVVWCAAATSLVWPLVYAAGDQTVDWFYPLPLVLLRLAWGPI